MTAPQGNGARDGVGDRACFLRAALREHGGSTAPRGAAAGGDRTAPVQPRRSLATAPLANRQPAALRHRQLRGFDCAGGAQARPRVKLALERDVRLVRCEDGRLEIALEPSAAKTLVTSLRANSRSGPTAAGWWWYRRRRGQPTVKSQEDARQAELEDRCARRSAGAGGAGTLSRRRDRRCTRGRSCRRLRPAIPTQPLPELAADDDGSAFGTIAYRKRACG